MPKPDFDLVSQDVKDTLERYVTHGIPTGSFLRAVLMNDLRGAFMLADEWNCRHLFHIVAYVYEKLPATCWGSPDAVTMWLDSFKHDEVHP